MNESIVSRTKKLCDRYFRDEVTLKDFQFQLEPMLGSFNSMAKGDVDRVREIINQLELIIHTIPGASQKHEVEKILPTIFQYLGNKGGASTDREDI